MSVARFIAKGDTDSTDFYAAVDQATPADIEAVLSLAMSTDAVVRRAVATTLPLIAKDDDSARRVVPVLVRMCEDADAQVRGLACFGLGQQLRHFDTPQVRDALAGRLADLAHETRCEALVGLAYRRDPRALPRVRQALARPSGDVWQLELAAAGALSDPSLHELVVRHLDGWKDPDAQRTAEAAVRLTDPEGPGNDLIDGVADLYRERVRKPETNGPLMWWELMSVMLDIAPHRSGEFLELVAQRLAGDPAAESELRTNSALAAMAGD